MEKLDEEMLHDLLLVVRVVLLLAGILLVGVVEGSAAARNGLRPGDRVEGTPTPERNDAISRINGYAPGSLLRLTVLAPGDPEKTILYLPLGPGRCAAGPRRRERRPALSRQARLATDPLAGRERPSRRVEPPACRAPRPEPGQASPAAGFSSPAASPRPRHTK